ncbi:DMT family transporter [Streptomyces sp. NBC_01498]|uniref:DMT family transporter n=1 Tax=Streptomyces sp. NBC_01498 TaxID=2975870 RepID=UPI002E7C3749|nr:DMT family transporter [Streptomyces sp. NBC_01498]WTL23550.1 DMT family transporter [Streptomyces sp. NBC_01498]
MSALALSVLLSLVSAVAYAAGAILQERVAADTPARPYAPLHHGVWWAAVALNGVGALLHVVALAYGPLSLVQPLGALTIVFALPMAAVFVRRKAGATAWRGALMATLGLAGLLALTGHAGSHSLGSGERLVVAGATAVLVGLLFVLAQAVRRPAARSVLLAASAGVAFGIASVFTKTVAVDWTAGTFAGQVPSLVFIAVLAAAGLLLSQASYRGAGLAAPLATVTVVNPVVAAAVGLTLFGEGFRYGLTGGLFALAFGVLTAGGLVLLTTERLAAQTAHGGPAHDDRDRDRVSVPGPTTPGATAERHHHAGPSARPGWHLTAYRASRKPEGGGAHRAQQRVTRHILRRAPRADAAPRRPLRSDADAARPEVGDGVDVGAVAGPRAHLEVEMRSRAVSGRP